MSSKLAAALISAALVACGGGFAVSASDELAVEVDTVVDGLTSPVGMAVPDDGTVRLLVIEQHGLIRVIEEGHLLAQPFLDLRPKMIELSGLYDERGLLGIALPPAFAENGRFFVYYSAPLRQGASEALNHTSHLSEFKVSAEDANRADVDSEQIILQVDQPFANHNGGQIAFGPDGYLYVGLGDGGDGGDPMGNGQNTDTLLGSILRIDVATAGAQAYAIPPDNPFVDGGGRAEIYAYGLRNPYRFSFDRGGELGLLVADVGQEDFEEVSQIEKGGNYGWNIREGTQCYQPASGCGQIAENGEPLLAPIIEYNHDVGISIIGGFVYRGEAIPNLQGSYVFGDWSKGFVQGGGQVFVTRPAASGLWEFETLAFANTNGGTVGERFVMAFGEDAAGELYVLVDSKRGPTGSGGALLKIVPAS